MESAAQIMMEAIGKRVVHKRYFFPVDPSAEVTVTLKYEPRSENGIPKKYRWRNHNRACDYTSGIVNINGCDITITRPATIRKNVAHGMEFVQDVKKVSY